MKKLGGMSLIVAGLLFLVADLLARLAGPVPSAGPGILAWLASGRLALSFVNETLFFAAMCLVPGVIALYEELSQCDKIRASIGVGIIAVIVPVLVILLVVHGRLVFPVYGLVVRNADVAELVVATFYGGLHAVWLAFALATLLLSLAMRRGSYGKLIPALGFLTAALDVVGSYPDRIGPTLALVCQVFFAAWWIAVGVKLRSSALAD